MEGKQIDIFTRQQAQDAYDAGTPIMTDAEFDARFPENSGYLGQTGKVEHEIPMLSQQKCHTEGELQRFIDKVRKAGEIMLYASLKVDGFACSLVYQDGKLVHASTRGDGHAGEDITAAFLKYVDKWFIPQIDKSGRFEIRGEVVLPKSQTKEGENPRNIAVGMCKRKELIDDDRRLAFYAWEIIDNAGNVVAPDFTTEYRIVGGGVFSTKDKAEDIIRAISARRGNFDAVCDGIVVRCVSREVQKKFGCTDHHPKWSMAYKFQTASVVSKVLAIEITTGSTGRKTPVAKINPVTIDGAKVSSVSIGSMAVLKELGLKVGQSVRVTRSGGVVPKILEVIKD